MTMPPLKPPWKFDVEGGVRETTDIEMEAEMEME
jgi:hypothetical protein